MSCAKSVTVNIPNDYTLANIYIGQGGVVEINGFQTDVQQPIITGLSNSIWIGRISPTAVRVIFKDGLQLTYDGFTYAFIDVPPSYHNRTSGLCGNFDSIAENDMQTPAGKIEKFPDQFAHEWRVKEICDPQGQNEMQNMPVEKPVDCVPHPCLANRENKQSALQVCKKLKSDVFAACDIDVEPFFMECMFDMCACQSDRATCMCAIFSAFANECKRQGKPVRWVEKVPECGEIINYVINLKLICSNNAIVNF